MNSNREFIHGKIREFIRKYYLNKLLKGAILFVIITLLVFIAYAVLEYFSYFNSTSAPHSSSPTSPSSVPLSSPTSPSRWPNCWEWASSSPTNKSLKSSANISRK